MENIAIRASSLGELFDCPARWEAKHLLGMRLPVSGAARLGTAVHAGTAVFDIAKLNGEPITIDDACQVVVRVLQDKVVEVDWDDGGPQEAEKLALPLLRLYCEQIAPQQNYEKVEFMCEPLTFTDLGLTLTGTVDRVRRTEKGLGIADIKTGKNAVAADGTVKTSAHAAQIGVYELLAAHALAEPIVAPAQIIGLQVARTGAGRRAAIGTIAGSLDLLLADGPCPGILVMASRLIQAGDFYGNPRSSLCTNKYCPAYEDCRWRL